MPRAPGESRRRLSRTVRGTRWEAGKVLADLRAAGSPSGVTPGVRVPESLAAGLRRRAESDGVSISEEIRRAIATWLDSKP
jgi:hypothetical protein